MGAVVVVSDTVAVAGGSVGTTVVGNRVAVGGVVGTTVVGNCVAVSGVVGTTVVGKRVAVGGVVGTAVVGKAVAVGGRVAVVIGTVVGDGADVHPLNKNVRTEIATQVQSSPDCLFILGDQTLQGVGSPQPSLGFNLHDS